MPGSDIPLLLRLMNILFRTSSLRKPLGPLSCSAAIFPIFAGNATKPITICATPQALTGWKLQFELVNDSFVEFGLMTKDREALEEMRASYNRRSGL